MMNSRDEKEHDGANEEKPNIKGDRLNIILLIYLYTLQNVASGLLHVLPLVMQNRKVSYADQAGFSIALYPACMKLLWAPIVDCVYSKKMGRRKSWIVPMQYIMGAIMLFTSINLEDLIGSDDGTRKPRIRLLTAVFFVFHFIITIQDVALDAWSLTMLRRRNIGYAGTCQSVGHAIGSFLAIVVSIVLDSKDFCNMFRSVPQNYGFISLANFLYFWSIVMVISTTMVFVFKNDDSLDNIDDDFECKLGFVDSYKHLWAILKVRPIQIFCVLLLTHEMAFGPFNGAVSLKLIDAGITRDKLVLLNIPSLPFRLVLSVVLSRYITGPHSIRTYTTFFVLKLIIGLALALTLFVAPYIKENEKQMLPIWYYSLLVFFNTAKNVTVYLLGIAVGAFFLRISDPRFGGIYMTLLNTASNIGHNWPITLCLWTINHLSIKTCNEDKIDMITECETIVDGYSTETLLCTVIGILWFFFWARKVIDKLDKLNRSLWIAELKSTTARQELLTIQ